MSPKVEKLDEAPNCGKVGGAYCFCHVHGCDSLLVPLNRESKS